ncbi:hypothetical protein FIV42_16545 [Persicimonas caeni]|uniref:Uncharacterized protein n=1 Tax=Persicimonas caeni TaxID=2292766 RepID=A0A4Y6PVZ6_PERCE|nr:hypothetical protein [Persicimonas caeni]QDG52289.1 hypothetical protein FIV42_16545 [Persicimonas caeni]QED33511.1 hypothetical protein FRD00_16540 [Persicimonas caeni]
MKLLFQFTDVPRRGQVWKTELDVDLTIHTRPALVAARDRFARAYGTNYAREELRRGVIRGLKDFGYKLVPQLDMTLQEQLYDLRSEAREHAIVANAAIDEYWLEEADYRAVERGLLAHTLGNPSSTARFVRDVATKLAELDPVDRMRHIYAVRGAYLGERLPFAQAAPELLADAFGGAQAIPRLEGPADLMDSDARANYERIVEIGNDTLASLLLVCRACGGPINGDQLDVEELRQALLVDVMAGLARRLVEDDEFLDTLIKTWVLPRVEESYEQMDERIDELLDHLAPTSGITREKFLAMDSCPEWLELAARLGSPLPEDIPRPDRSS